MRINRSIWRVSFIIFFLSFTCYARNGESLNTDITNTYQNLLSKSEFQDRVFLVDEFVKRASKKREAIMKQRERTNSDLLVLFHINILRSFHNELDKSSSANCMKSLANLEMTLYPNRVQTVMFPFRRSIYNLYNRMCAL